MEKKQTAVDWLIEQIGYKNEFGQTLTGLIGDSDITKLLDQAKQLEKQQIEKTWFDSTMQFDNAAEMTYKKSFEQYYTETYESTQRDRSGEA